MNELIKKYIEAQLGDKYGSPIITRYFCNKLNQYIYYIYFNTKQINEGPKEFRMKISKKLQKEIKSFFNVQSIIQLSNVKLFMEI